MSPLSSMIKVQKLSKATGLWHASFLTTFPCTPGHPTTTTFLMVFLLLGSLHDHRALGMWLILSEILFLFLLTYLIPSPSNMSSDVTFTEQFFLNS